MSWPEWHVALGIVAAFGIVYCLLRALFAKTGSGEQHSALLWLIVALVVLGYVATKAQADAAPLPEDPFRRCAVKQRAAGYAGLEWWRRLAYERGLAEGTTCQGRAYLTSYGPWEPLAMYGGPFAADRHIRLTAAHCAADPAVPFGTLVWAAGSIRIVRDRGGWVKVWRARRRDPRNDRNLDFYTLTKDKYFSRSTPYVLLGQKGAAIR